MLHYLYRLNTSINCKTFNSLSLPPPLTQRPPLYKIQTENKSYWYRFLEFCDHVIVDSADRLVCHSQFLGLPWQVLQYPKMLTLLGYKSYSGIPKTFRTRHKGPKFAIFATWYEKVELECTSSPSLHMRDIWNLHGLLHPVLQSFPVLALTKILHGLVTKCN